MISLPDARRPTALVAVLLLLASLCLPRPARADTPAKKVPVTVSADKLDYDRSTDVYVAVGHVKVEQEGVRLEADKVVLNGQTGEAQAEGRVSLQDKGDAVRAEKLTVNLNTREGVITNGDLFMKKENYHLRGEVIERR
jgi:LPS-assembly protein